MPTMMHRNCHLGCCPKGSRAEDKRRAREELRMEFLADVPPEVEAEQEIITTWYGENAPHVGYANSVPHTAATATRPRAWHFE